MKGNKIAKEGIAHEGRWLIAYLMQQYNAIDFENQEKRLLLVEGETDRLFIEKITNNDDVNCIIPNMSLDPDLTNNKKAIVHALFGLFKPEMLCEPERSNVLELKLKEKLKNLVFGMVDLDYDAPSSYEPMPWLFVTDTHDLETLLLSTDEGDEGLVRRLKIPEDYSKKAYYLAYQLGFLRREVAKLIDKGKVKEKTFLKPIKSEANYEKFVDKKTCKINLEKLLKFFGCNKNKDEILNNKEIRKKIDKDSFLWKGELKDFDKSTYEDFWRVVNGHEILSLIRYIYQQEANECDKSKALGLIYGDFENTIIDNYDYRTLNKTKIYEKMENAKIVDSDKIKSLSARLQKIIVEHESR